MRTREKRCVKCGQAPAIRSWCRECHREATRRWRAANPDHGVAYNAQRRVSYPTRDCIGCGFSFTPPRKDSRHCCARCRGHVRMLPSSATEHIVKYHGGGVLDREPAL